MEPATHSPRILKGRQLDCMLLVKEGLSSKQIARKLGISHRTVDDHVAAALESLGVHNRMAAISRMYEMEQAEATTHFDPKFMLGHAMLAGEQHVIAGPSKVRAAAVLPPLGGSRNVASRSDRLAWMARIAAFCTMIGCAVILTVLGVYEIVNDFNR